MMIIRMALMMLKKMTTIMIMIMMTMIVLKVDKLVLADSVIEQLLVDNDRLTGELGRLKENFKVTDI